jgi:hypothetical protein
MSDSVICNTLNRISSHGRRSALSSCQHRSIKHHSKSILCWEQIFTTYERFFFENVLESSAYEFWQFFGQISPFLNAGNIVFCHLTRLIFWSEDLMRQAYGPRCKHVILYIVWIVTQFLLSARPAAQSSEDLLKWSQSMSDVGYSLPLPPFIPPHLGGWKTLAWEWASWRLTPVNLSFFSFEILFIKALSSLHLLNCLFSPFEILFITIPNCR